MIVNGKTFVGVAEVVRSWHELLMAKQVWRWQPWIHQRIVDKCDSEQVGIPRRLFDQREAKLFAEQFLVVSSRHRITIRNSWNGTVKPVAEEYDVVGSHEVV